MVVIRIVVRVSGWHFNNFSERWGKSVIRLEYGAVGM